MTITETAWEFFEACESGKGGEVCKAWCHDGATFSCQAGALGEVTTVAGYADWMKGILGPLPDGRYELKAFSADEERNTVTAAAVFHGTHTGEGGPIPPTGKAAATDYVYVWDFEGGKIRHMTKIWNDLPALQDLGWA
ncbi:MAG: ester cyclase [Alphaproteobacteria bacterium]|jgi:predicted ester cyclase|nr:ester cyclase [Alphaproteobacteria bacterium]MDP6590989.1 ester cyclase [Alphaproteobacteria bacterium]MDP6818984.1 ester cyclase [Alphaproteobacteria bacterium]|tara:strand:- start:564 stop:977 length:414 start_codon:yes stop_codon:yes gene_type:complete